MKRWVLCLVSVCLTTILFLRLWTISAESSARWTPDYPMEDLTAVLQKALLSDEDYSLLYTQTGLARPAVDTLLRQGRSEMVFEIQQAFFTEPTILCEKNSPISREESAAKGKACPIIAVENGDILITPNSHTFGWRNGHAALVVDAENRLTLESAVLGEVSGIQSLDKWERYPAFLVLRVRGLSEEQRSLAAVYALESLTEIPYGFTVGVLSAKYAEPLKETHCAHLVWAAYRKFGIDLDANGGRIITPRQLAASEHLEVVQVYGIDPARLWK